MSDYSEGAEIERECRDCGSAECTGDCERDRDDDETDDCFHCGGEGYTECSHPMECTKPHLGGSYGSDGGEVCPCASCGGSGLAKDMTIW